MATQNTSFFLFNSEAALHGESNAAQAGGHVRLERVPPGQGPTQSMRGGCLSDSGQL